MKTIRNLILLAGLAAAITSRAAAQSSDAPAPELSGPPPTMDLPPGPPPGEDPGVVPAAEPAPADAAAAAPATPIRTVMVGSPAAPHHFSNVPSEPIPASGGTNAASGLRMNFRNVPLEMVLNYLSDAAGFVIVLDTQVRGNVDVWSNQPLSKDEAVDLLNTILNKNGYAAIRNGRTLTIVNKDEAKTKDIPVISGSDPDQIPKTDEMVTQIIPVRFVEAAQLIKDLQPLVSLQSTITANEAGNAIVITDTRANIHRVAEIIKAIDTGAEAVTEVRVFHLAYADPVEMSALLGNLFPDDSKNSGSQTPVRFGGGGGRFAAMFGGGGNTSSSSSGNSDRIKKMQRVIAVADQRTASVIVSAPNDLMDQISRMISQLDNNPAKKQNVYVFHLENADPQEVLPVLQDMFQKNSSSRSTRSTTQSALMSRSSSTSTGSSSTSATSGFGGTTTGGGFGGGGGRTGGGFGN
jgi:general secretion pathway protein D